MIKGESVSEVLKRITLLRFVEVLWLGSCKIICDRYMFDYMYDYYVK